jgi:hypothetical protein
MNREKLVSGIRVIRQFVNKSLGLNRSFAVSGFELSEHLLSAAAYIDNSVGCMTRFI